MQKLKAIIFSVICVLFSGCSNNNIAYYANRHNIFDFRDFFKGNLDGWGMLLDWRGRQIKSFHVKMVGSWKGNQGLLEEWFEFDDGVKTTRNWKINFDNNETFTATADDVVGIAAGIQKGNAVNVKYILKLPYGNKTIDLNMDDWMYLITKEAVLNRTIMKKFGFQVGELVIFMKKSN